MTLVRQRSEPFETRLVAARPLSPLVRELVLERQGGEPFRFDPGQWVNLLLPTAAGEIKRAYSIASAPDPRGSPRFELAVTKVDGGPGSTYLHDLPLGAPVHAIGPQGLFTREPEDEPPALFIGTGTGITPLRSMVRAALAHGSHARLWILFGARVEEDILYRDELDILVAQHPHLRHVVTLSRPAETWTGRRGWVQDHLPGLVEELRATTTEPPHAYVCGLDRMVGAVRSMLRDQLGFDRKRVHAERYD